MEKYYLSIDIGGTEIKSACLDKAGNILEKWQAPTPNSKKACLKQIKTIVYGREVEQLKGLALCAPGKISGSTIHFGGSLPFLEGIDFKQIYRHLHIPVAVINDGKAATLAEAWLGNLKDIANCAAIILGTAVGGGIILNGHLLNGAHGQAGEISFTQLNCHAAHDNGFKGFAGQDVSAVHMINMINNALDQPDRNNGFKAFAAIKEGNEQANFIFSEFCYRLALMIMNLQATIDVDRFVIGGGISSQPILLNKVNAVYDEILTQSPLYQKTLVRPEIVKAKFNNDSNLYGALYNLLLQVNGEKLI